MTPLPADERMRRGSEGVKSGGRALVVDKCSDRSRLTRDLTAFGGWNSLPADEHAQPGAATPAPLFVATTAADRGRKRTDSRSGRRLREPSWPVAAACVSDG